ncbi:PPOX class probable F420-dependent enzyme [Thermosporothrix hazakensis]|jgi:PPOX class probable F420-dependent enzyme|uniref:PPOX class probable F420-dependent enzyme n=1 Tax=Thermosporothrix hazakensis TaxID=644383 RepID=A0A326U235_THEHA|nr:PPOX class F420-dependent oxidoreductase [Thermosporothrix hazakensis]PZW22493.1 PPOX class probable F420-dependent enzyme [Thermosporothrix hazakensis]GCE50184.1 PPOX class F420-dependent enzyme [Thermosporothrix hazakensis]
MIPESHLDLVQRPILAHLATIMEDGSPQITPVWIDYDGSLLLVNTAAGRKKERNMRERPAVALDIVDPDNASRKLMIMGRVIEATADGTEEHIDRLSQRYLGVPTYPSRVPGETRLIVKIEPERVIAQ